MVKKTLALALLSCALLGGCTGSESPDLSKEDDAKLRNNLSRELTPEEIARMNNAAPAGDATKAGAPGGKKGN